MISTPTKICSKCSIEKKLCEFSKHGSGRFGVAAECKACYKIYRAVNKDKISKQLKLYRNAHKDKAVAYNKTYISTHKTEIAIQKAAYYATHKKEYATRNKKYCTINKDKIRNWNRIYENQKRRNNAMFKLNRNISNAVYLSLKGNKNGRLWEKTVGYSLKKLKKHLEKRFLDGMSWENYGLRGWTIDHKIPISVFNFINPNHEDFKRCWALSNLQPMWAKENLEKRAKLTKHFQPSLLLG